MRFGEQEKKARKGFLWDPLCSVPLIFGGQSGRSTLPGWKMDKDFQESCSAGGGTHGVRLASQGLVPIFASFGWVLFFPSELSFRTEPRGAKKRERERERFKLEPEALARLPGSYRTATRSQNQSLFSLFPFPREGARKPFPTVLWSVFICCARVRRRGAREDDGVFNLSFSVVLVLSSTRISPGKKCADSKRTSRRSKGCSMLDPLWSRAIRDERGLGMSGLG